jgi:hypothetical protein
MNKVVRENYPASSLPEDLREGISPGSRVTVMVLEETSSPSAQSLEEIFAARRPPFRSAEEIVAGVNQLRDEWDE